MSKKDRDAIGILNAIGGSGSGGSKSKSSNRINSSNHRLSVVKLMKNDVHSQPGGQKKPPAGLRITEQWGSTKQLGLKRPAIGAVTSTAKRIKTSGSPEETGDEHVPESSRDSSVECIDEDSPTRLPQSPNRLARFAPTGPGAAGPGPSSQAHRAHLRKSSDSFGPPRSREGEYESDDPIDMLGSPEKTSALDQMLDGDDAYTLDPTPLKPPSKAKPQATNRLHRKVEEKLNQPPPPPAVPPSAPEPPAPTPPVSRPPPGTSFDTPISIDDSFDEPRPRQSIVSSYSSEDDPIEDVPDDRPPAQKKPPAPLRTGPALVPNGTVKKLADLFDQKPPYQGTSPGVKPPIGKPTPIAIPSDPRSTAQSQPPKPKLAHSMQAKSTSSVPKNNPERETVFPKISSMVSQRRVLPLVKWFREGKQHGPWSDLSDAFCWAIWTTNTMTLCSQKHFDPEHLGRRTMGVGPGTTLDFEHVQKMEQSDPVVSELVVLALTLDDGKQRKSTSGMDRVIMHFDKTASEWKTQAYKQLVLDIKAKNKAKVSTILDSAANAILETAERECALTPPPPSSRPTHLRPPVTFPDDEYKEESRTPSTNADASGPNEDDIEVAAPERRTNPLRRSRRQAEAIPLGPSINDTELLFAYPPVNITRGELARLEPDEFLNDTLIEFGLKLWMNDLISESPELAEQIWVFNSFFYKKLNVKKVEQGYQNVKKWTAKLDIFKKKYIVVPINENLHWYLAVIFEPQYALEAPDSPEAPSKPARTSTRKSTRSSSVPPTPRVDTDAVSIDDSEAAERQEVDATLALAGPPSSVPPTSPKGDITSEEFEVDEDGDAMMTGPWEKRGILEMKSESGTSTPGPVDEEMEEVQSFKELSLESKEVEPGSDDGTPVPPKADKEPTIVDDPEVEEPLEPEPEIVEQTAEVINEIAAAKCNDKRTHIFVMDSLGGRHPQVTRVLKQWLKLEAADKKGVNEIRDALGHNVKVPYQPNHVDCGVYLLHFAEVFVRKADDIKRLTMMKGLNDAKIRDEIFNKDVLRKRRKALKDRVEELAEQWKAARAPPAPANGNTANGEPAASTSKPATSSTEANGIVEPGTVAPTSDDAKDSTTAEAGSSDPQPDTHVQDGASTSVAPAQTNDDDDGSDIEFISINPKVKTPPKKSGRKPAKKLEQSKKPNSTKKKEQQEPELEEELTSQVPPLRFYAKSKD